MTFDPRILQGAFTLNLWPGASLMPLTVSASDPGFAPMTLSPAPISVFDGGQVQVPPPQPDGAAVGLQVAGAAGSAATPVHLEQGIQQPLTWAGYDHEVTWTIAQLNYYDDANMATFSNPFPDQFVPLVKAAMGIWESVADIDLVQVADTPAVRMQRPDIRVGLDDLSTSLQHPTIGFTHWQAVDDKFLPDVLVTIEDPSKNPVTRLPDGDFKYNGWATTVLQDLLHEIGHALGLAHNPNDPNSVMNPVLGSVNKLPDAQDIASLQALYGAPTEAHAAMAMTDLPFMPA